MFNCKTSKRFLIINKTVRTATRGLIDEFLAWHISGVSSWNLTMPLETLTFFSIIVVRLFLFTMASERSQIGSFSALLTGQNVELRGHAPYSPDWEPNYFSLLPHFKKKCVPNDSDTDGHQKILLECSKSMFWRCLNRSRKRSTNYGRTSEHSEYHYAKKCHTFLWKCHKYARPETHRSISYFI